MVVCKYFQQGNCRFGQYCRFEHVNNFGNRNKPIYIDGKNIALIVAEDVLAAERGGQWILSCFGPFKEQPCIPGMEDVSPEEVRWNMYKAQTDGTTDQVKLQFQQMCQDMKAKHEALKNPTPETLAILEKIQKSNQDKSNFAFSSSALNANNSAFTTTNNVFVANSTFGANTAFNSNSSNMFNNASVFGSKPVFGTNSVFSNNIATSNSLFGNNPQMNQSTFGSPQTTQAFGTSSVFGNQPAFGQNPTFSSSATQASIFSQPVQTSQSSIFGGSSGATNTIFANSSGPTSSMFGAANQTTASASMFGQATTNFGQTSVFGNMNSNFGPTSSSSQIFGVQPSFNNTIVSAPSNNFMQMSTTVFGNAISQNTTSPFASSMPTTFGTFSQSNVPFSAPFSSTTTTAPTTTTTVFGTAQNFGNVFTSPSSTQNVFGNSPFVINSTVTIVDDSMYTDEGGLTQEEENAFLADQFILSKIPLNPPTKELR